MKILMTFLIILLSNMNLSAGNPWIENLDPQPRQAYIREIFSAVFSINSDTKILLNPEAPDYEAALFLNSQLKTMNVDSLEIKFLIDTNVDYNNIILTQTCEITNKMLAKVPDQKIQISEEFPGAEGYIIDVTPAGAIIAGSDSRGLHYGVQTFIKLLNTVNMKNNMFACRVIDAPEMPVRSYYYPINLLPDNNTVIAKKWLDTASLLMLNGVVMPDVKFNFLSDMPQKYYDSLRSINQYALDKLIDITPGIMPFGYSDALLYWDVNWASGVPVRLQQFVINNDIARLVPHEDTNPPNGGFEDHKGDNFTGFEFIDAAGEISFFDSQVKHSGNLSIRFENFQQYDPQYGHGRICFKTKVTPFTMYRISGYVKTENINPGTEIKMQAINTKGRTLQYANTGIPMTTNGWKKVDICFNSLNSDTIYAYWGVWEAKTGKIWWDDIELKEVEFVNLLRRDGCPLTVSHPILDIAYIEGKDFDTLRDPKLGRLYSWPGGYDTFHQPPVMTIPQGSNIHNGDTILVSYYHAITVYDGQVMASMTEPKVYDRIERELKILDSLIKPKSYFMNHDEIRVLNWDFGDNSTGLEPGEILADNVNKCYDIIKKYNPGAQVWDWSDMFDEYHNAKKSNYYLVNGDLTGSADLINKSIGIANWNGQKNSVNNSLSFFSDKSFSQVSCPFYDQDENQIRQWKEWTRGVPGFKGMIYTTWSNNYKYLGHFAYYAWNHAPFIYHYPSYYDPQKDNTISFSISGDKWDQGWLLTNAKVFYRTNPGDQFVEISASIDIGDQYSSIISFPEAPQWLQYYIEATDIRGWTTKQPFGNDHYFELGQKPTSVNDESVNNIYIKISPNPIYSGQKINAEISSEIPVNSIIQIVNIRGEIISQFQPNPLSKNSIEIDTKGYLPGIYFIKLYTGDSFKAAKFEIMR